MKYDVTIARYGFVTVEAKMKRMLCLSQMR